MKCLPVMIPPTIANAIVMKSAAIWKPAWVLAVLPSMPAVVFVANTVLRAGQSEYKLKTQEHK